MPRQAYRDGVQDRLGLVLNAMVLWTTRSIDAAVTQRTSRGWSLLKHKSPNVVGRRLRPRRRMSGTRCETRTFPDLTTGMQKQRRADGA